MVIFTTAQSPDDIRQILALQAANHPSALDDATLKEQGFVTVQHSFELLSEMNRAAPSVIAKAGDRVVGYCLKMPRAFRQQIPILESMFAMIDGLEWRGKRLKDQDNWFVMGQVCVAESHRGQGVFEGMYAHLKAVSREQYDFVITEVAQRNTRSMRAHEKIGFQLLHRFEDAQAGEVWNLILWAF